MNKTEWYSTSEKLPQIGDVVYVSDGYKIMKVTVRHLPNNSWDTNVIKWRYTDE